MPFIFDPTVPYVPPLRPKEDGAFTRGVKQGIEELKGTGYGALGLLGAKANYEPLKQWGLENAQEHFQLSAEMGHPEDQIENIETVGDAAKWALRGLGYLTPQFAASMLGGGVGGALAKMGVSTATKQLAQQGIRKGVTTVAEKAAVENAIHKIALTRTAGRLGGAAATSYIQEAGSMYPEAVEHGYDEPGRIAAYAIPAAALDVIPEMGLWSKFTKGGLLGRTLNKVEPEDLLKRGLMRRIATSGAQQSLMEGTTEAGQSFFERLGERQPTWGPEAWSDYINSFALGALGGGVAGGAAGAFERSRKYDPINLILPPAPPIYNLVTEPPPNALQQGIQQNIIGRPPMNSKERAAYEAQFEAAARDTTNIAGQPWGYRTIKRPTGEKIGNQSVTANQEVPLTAQEYYDIMLGHAPEHGYNNLQWQPAPNPQTGGAFVAPIQGPMPYHQLQGIQRVLQQYYSPMGPFQPQPQPQVQPQSQAQPQYESQATAEAWKGVAREAWLKVKGRSRLIDKVIAAASPEEAAAVAREVAKTYVGPSKNVFGQLSAVHKALTGQTIEEYDNAESLRGNEGQVREGGTSGQPSVQPSAVEGGSNLQQQAPGQPSYRQVGIEGQEGQEGQAPVGETNVKQTPVVPEASAAKASEGQGTGAVTPASGEGRTAAEGSENAETRSRKVTHRIEETPEEKWDAMDDTIPFSKLDDDHQQQWEQAIEDDYATGEQQQKILESFIRNQRARGKKGDSGSSTAAMVDRIDPLQRERNDIEEKWNRVNAVYQQLERAVAMRWPLHKHPLKFKLHGTDKTIEVNNLFKAKRLLDSVSETREEITKKRNDLTQRYLERKGEESTNGKGRTEKPRVESRTKLVPDYSSSTDIDNLISSASDEIKKLRKDLKLAEEFGETAIAKDILNRINQLLSFRKFYTKLLLSLVFGDNKTALKEVEGNKNWSKDHVAILQAMVENNPEKLLKATANKTTNPVLKKLTQALIDTGVLPNVGLFSDSSNAGGLYAPDDDAIFFKSSHVFSHMVGNLESLILHEFVHAATIHNIAYSFNIWTKELVNGLSSLTPKEMEYRNTNAYRAARRIFELFEYLRQNHNISDKDGLMYGMYDPMEFAAEALVNEDFQRKLAVIPYKSKREGNLSGAIRIVNAFSEFVAAIAQMFGFKTALEHNALAEVIRATTSLVEDRTKLPLDKVVKQNGHIYRINQYTRTIPVIQNYYNPHGSPRQGPIFSHKPTVAKVATTANEAQAVLDTHLRSWGTNAWGGLRRLSKGMMMLNQIEEIYGERLPAITRFRDSVKAAGQLIAQIRDSATPLSDLWGKLSREQRELQSTLQAESTIQEIWPNLPFNHEKNKHLTTNNQKETADNKTRYEVLKKQWEKLDETGKKLFVEEANWNAIQRDLQEQVINNLITESFDAQIAAATVEKRMQYVESLKKERESLLNRYGRRLKRVRGPYFPLTRAGNFIAIGRSKELVAAEEAADRAWKKVTTLVRENASDNDIKQANEAKIEAFRTVDRLKRDHAHYDVSFWGSEAAAKQRAVELRSQGLVAKNWQKGEWNYRTSGLDKRVINQIQEGIAKRDPLIAERIAPILERLLVEALPEQSIRKEDLQRQGIAGYEPDMGISFEKHVNRVSRGIAHIKFTPQIHDALASLNEQAKASTVENDVEVFHTVLDAHAASMTFKETPMQDLAVNLGYIWMLAWAPAFLMQQVLQNPMITIPSLSGLVVKGRAIGYTRALMEWGKAATEVWNNTHSSVENWSPRTRFDYKSSAFTPEEQAMFQRFHERNQLDTTINHELDTNPQGQKLRRLMLWAGIPAQWTETANRASAALTAYRLARAGGMPITAAQKYAERIVADTHIDYSPENAALYMRPGVVPYGKIMFQFKKFQLGMIYLIIKNVRNATKGESPEIKKEARRILFTTLTLQQIMAGAAGFPLAAPIALIAEAIAKFWPDDDEPDFNIWFRDTLEELFGVEGGRAIAKGIPNLLGLDISGNVGMGNIVSPMPFIRETSDLRSQWIEFAVGMFGPTGSMISQFADGLQLMAYGDTVKGVEKIMPRLIRNAIKSGRFGTEGVTTKLGNPVVQPDELGMMELVATAAGLQLSELTDMYEAKAYVEGYVRQRDRVRKHLIADAWKNPNDLKIKESIREFNERHPEDKITASAILQARKQYMRYQRELTPAHVRLTKREKHLAGDIEWAKP